MYIPKSLLDRDGAFYIYNAAHLLNVWKEPCVRRICRGQLINMVTPKGQVPLRIITRFFRQDLFYLALTSL
jgi:hypothetical protein